MFWGSLEGLGSHFKVALHTWYQFLAGMDRRSLLKAEAEAEAEGKKASAFGRRQKQKVYQNFCPKDWGTPFHYAAEIGHFDFAL